MNEITQCSFCDKTKDEVRHIVVKGDAGICNECVMMAANMLISNHTVERHELIDKNKRIAELEAMQMQLLPALRNQILAELANMITQMQAPAEPATPTG